MDIVKLCYELGAAGAVEVPISSIVFRPEFRELCEQNACGRFAKSYTCPPFIGNVEDLIAKANMFKTVVFFQNVYELEDSFDYEGMIHAQDKHNAMTLDVSRRTGDNALVLAASGCSLCGECAAVTGEPCRNPGSALSSLEAYGIHVVETCKAIGLKYINGENTVTYFSAVFLM